MFCHNKCKCCSSMWWAGFFSFAAVVHLARVLAHIQLQVGSHVISNKLSLIIAAVAGLLAIVFCKKGCASCGCAPAK